MNAILEALMDVSREHLRDAKSLGWALSFAIVVGTVVLVYAVVTPNPEPMERIGYLIHGPVAPAIQHHTTDVSEEPGKAGPAIRAGDDVGHMCPRAGALQN
ncbi:hypothetical protein SCD75_02890 [Prescottella equi]|nr:hypothetical protein SCD75_00555 [Prescottella equi]WQB74489.1 hypothetical protein SCD75_02890 [Prescottella equi]